MKDQIAPKFEIPMQQMFSNDTSPFTAQEGFKRSEARLRVAVSQP